jgi:hypothetical protein
MGSLSLFLPVTNVPSIPKFLVIGHHSGEVEYIIAKVDWITR